MSVARGTKTRKVSHLKLPVETGLNKSTARFKTIRDYLFLSHWVCISSEEVTNQARSIHAARGSESTFSYTLYGAACAVFNPSSRSIKLFYPMRKGYSNRFCLSSSARDLEIVSRIWQKLVCLNVTNSALATPIDCAYYTADHVLSAQLA